MRIVRLIIILFFIFSLLTLISPFVSPADFILAAVLALMIPIVAILNFLLFLFLLFRRSWTMAFPLVALGIFSFIFLPATVSFDKSAHATSTNSTSILSYNVGQFARPQKYYFDRYWKGDSGIVKSKQMIDFVASHPADIKCIQEFYTDSSSLLFNTAEKIGEQQGYHVVQSAQLLRINRAKFGVAIFSKFPVLNQGEFLFSNNTFNRGVWADLQVGNDTIRVVNVHLQSNQRNIADRKKLLQKWKYDQVSRARQADQMADFIALSPFPVVLCGDLNATPFEYTYWTFRARLANSFETGGSGLGSTFHLGSWPIIRIDHQFFSKELTIEAFETLDGIVLSDHYPVFGSYKVN